MRHTTKKCIKNVLVLGAVAMVSLTSVHVRAEEKLIKFGTGGVTGVYYPVGGTVCRFINRKMKDHGVRCSVESTGGSIYNLNSLRQGQLDFAFAQSDWQDADYKGEGVFADLGTDKDLRSVFSLHSEALTIVARRDANIKSLDDLKGKRFNIGNLGSGTRSTIEELMHVKGWSKNIFKQATEFKVTEQAQKLCDNEIDAFAFNTGHPNGAIQEVTSACDAVIVPVVGDAVNSLLKRHSYYAHAIIPGNMYIDNPHDIPTYGVKATIVSSAKVDDELVYLFVKSVFENFENFKITHPVLAHLKKEDMISNGLIAPLHEGAKRYYIEAGLLKE